MSELRTRMIQAMTARGFSPRTQEAYVRAVVGLARHYRRAPDQLSADEVQAYIALLFRERKRSWSTCSQAAHAFRFFYHVTLGREKTAFHVPAPKQPQKLPDILSREEVWRLLRACTHPWHRLLLATTYAAGLRVSEVVALKVADLDADRMTIHIVQGKGGKDRSVPFSQRLLQDWRAYWRIRPPHVWLFANRQGTRPIDITVAQKLYTMTKRVDEHQKARNSRPGGELGVTAVLHTWGQTLSQHVHVHCVVTGGALPPEGARWIRARPGFLFPVRALAKLFRGRFLAGLRRAGERGALHLTGALAALAEPAAFATWLAALRAHAWVVDCKPPFAGPDQVLAYLARSTHRVAVSNDRLVALDDGRVRFRWRDYADGDRGKVMELDAEEFLRRFLLHIVPDGFVRIRHFGLLANRHRAAKLAQCRALLAQPPPPAPAPPESLRALMLRVTGLDIDRCPVCQQGQLRPRDRLPPAPPAWDTS